MQSAWPRRARWPLRRSRPRQGFGWAPLLAEALANAADVAQAEARYDEAEKGFHAAAMAAEQSGYDELRLDAYFGLLQCAFGRGRYDDALHWGSYARAAIERMGLAPARLGRLSHRLGLVYAEKGDRQKAIAEYRLAIDSLTRAFGPRHDRVAEVIFDVGNYYLAADEYDKAFAELDKALRIWREIGGDGHPKSILTLLLIGEVRGMQGHWAEALPLVQRAVAASARVYGDAHEVSAGCFALLARVQGKLGRIDESLATHERALAILRKGFGPQHRFVAMSLLALAATLLDAGRLDEAAARQGEGVAILARHAGTSRDMVHNRRFLAAILVRQRKYAEAIAELERALAAAQASLVANDPLLADTLGSLGRAHHKNGQPARALPYFERALRMVRTSGTEPARRSTAELRLAKALWDARAGRARALRLAEQSLSDARAAGDKERIEAAQTWLTGHRPARHRRRAARERRP